MRVVYFLLVSMFVFFSLSALANPPPGVGPSVLIDEEDQNCSLGYEEPSGEWVAVYAGHYTVRHSNGATGHTTFKCKMDLQEGFDPLVLYWEVADIPWPGCYSTISVEEDKATWMGQCFGYWSQ